MKKIFVATSMLIIFTSCGENGGNAPGFEAAGTVDDPKNLFVTAAQIKGDVGLAGFDSLCNSDTNKPAGGATFKALVASTSRASGLADWPLEPNTSYQNRLGQFLGTTNSNAKFVFPLSAFIGPVGTPFVWTGMDTSMDIGFFNCLDWSQELESGQYGKTDGTTDAVSFSNSGCGTTLQLICVEQ